jgi:hypothetical protein
MGSQLLVELKQAVVKMAWQHLFMGFAIENMAINTSSTTLVMPGQGLMENDALKGSLVFLR